MVKQLAAYRKIIQKGREKWPDFLQHRDERLVQMARAGGGAEKIAEVIIEHVFTQVLDWATADVCYQIEHSDIVLTCTGVKRLVIEVKRPGKLAWNQYAIHKALAQARRYADRQKIRTIAVTDGHMFYAADIEYGGLKERLYVSLSSKVFPEDLWWISTNGIYRNRENYISQLTKTDSIPLSPNDLLHPKYKIPARCFGYVEDATNPKTWKLPYLNCDGSVDTKRLSGAIRCIVSNYRGAKVGDIPDSAIPKVLKRLYAAAEQIGKLPYQSPKTTDCYRQLVAALKQFESVN